MARYDFASDNTAPAAPEALDALVAANSGFTSGYGSDPVSAQAADAVRALQKDPTMCQALGQPFVDYYSTLKLAEHQRLAQAEDAQEFHRREYFGRI